MHNFIYVFTESSTTGLTNGKIIIKDLKESRLYHELINEAQEKEKLKDEKLDDKEHSSIIELDKKKKKGQYIIN